MNPEVLIVLIMATITTNGFLRQLAHPYKAMRQLQARQRIGLKVNTPEHEFCEQFDHDPWGCRAAHQDDCIYVCGTGNCVRRPKNSQCKKGGPVPEHLCASHCYDLCACKLTKTCDYDSTTDTCVRGRVGTNNVCTDELFEENECRRAGAFYMMGGGQCYSPTQKGDCTVEKVIKAVDVSGTREYLDSHDILHQAETPEDYFDPFGTRVVRNLSRNPIVPQGKDHHFHKYHVQGGLTPTEGKGGRCLMYPLWINEDGFYELTIKFFEAENYSPGQRLFNVYFNEVPIQLELDLVKVLGGSHRYAEFILNFQVSSVVGSFHKIMVLKSHRRPVYITNEQVLLEFCYSNCNVLNGNYQVSAFSLVKFKNDLGSLPTPTPAPPRKPCSEFSGSRSIDICKCKKHGCEHNVLQGTCEEGNQICSEAMFKGTPLLGECVREGYFYALSGVVCRNYAQRGNCQLKRVIKSVNINGPEVTGSEGIVYEEETKGHYHDPLRTRFPRTMPPYGLCGQREPVRDSDPADIPVYMGLIYGDHDQFVPGKCIEYWLEFEHDGPYQLDLRMMEAYWDKPGQRLFTVKLNGVEVLKEVDLFLLNRECRGTKFLINFYIRQKQRKLKVRGHPTSYLERKEAKLEFCYSNCSVPDPVYIVSGFNIFWLDANDPDSGETAPPPTTTTTTTAATTTTKRTTTTTTTKPPITITTAKPTTTKIPTMIPPPATTTGVTTKATTTKPATKKPPTTTERGTPTTTATSQPPPGNPTPEPPSSPPGTGTTTTTKKPITTTTTETPSISTTTSTPPNGSSTTTTTTEVAPPPVTTTTTTTTTTTRPTLPPPPSTEVPTPEPKKKCEVYDGRPCECNEPGVHPEFLCEYDESTGTCYVGEPRKNRCYQCSGTVGECQRQKTFYVDGGVTCYNAHTKGFCDFDEKGTWALSFGTNALMKVDRYHQIFRPATEDTSGVILGFNQKQVGKFEMDEDAKPFRVENCTDGEYFVEWNAEDVYCTGMYSTTGCLNVTFNVEYDGVYELSLKLAPFELGQGDLGKHVLSIKVNEDHVSQYFRPHTYENKTNEVMDLGITFKVLDQGRTFLMKGYQPRRFDSEKVKVSICTPQSCDTEGRPNYWAVGGVSLMRMKDVGDRKSICDSLQSQYEMVGNNRSLFACPCRIHGCEYDSVTGKCEKRESKEFGGCSQCYFTKEECRWADSYHLNGGILCYQPFTSGKCWGENESSPLALVGINFGRYEDKLTAFGNDSRNVYHDYELASYYTYNSTFQAITKYSYESEVKCVSARTPEPAPNCPDRARPQYAKDTWEWLHFVHAPTEFQQELFGTYRRGHRCIRCNIQDCKSNGPDHVDKLGSAECRTCSFELREPGGYQLNLKTGEYHYNFTGKRTFSFIFEGVFIIRELDIYAVTWDTWVPLDININFILKTEQLVYVKGFPPVRLQEARTIHVGACYGDCMLHGTTRDNHYHWSAVSIIKLPSMRAAGLGSLLD